MPSLKLSLIETLLFVLPTSPPTLIPPTTLAWLTEFEMVAPIALPTSPPTFVAEVACTFPRTEQFVILPPFASCPTSAPTLVQLLAEMLTLDKCKLLIVPLTEENRPALPLPEVMLSPKIV